ncbi:MAG TPA: hypothetical protein VFS66_01230 [Acidimicrobiia bacterium]|nr:hypothetical protein [Acidimicrobiia bacterium]
MGRQIRRVAILLPASVLVLSACAAGADRPSPVEGEDPAPSSTTSSTTVPVAPTSLSGYRECLAAEGVIIPEITFDGRGRPMMARAMTNIDLTDPAVGAALSRCSPLIAGLLNTSADAELESLVQANLEEFAECVRDHGVAEFPDPVRRFEGVGEPFPSSRIPWTDPDLAGAVSVCNRRSGSTSP